MIFPAGGRDRIGEIHWKGFHQRASSGGADNLLALALHKAPLHQRLQHIGAGCFCADAAGFFQFRFGCGVRYELVDIAHRLNQGAVGEPCRLSVITQIDGSLVNIYEGQTAA